LWDWGSEGKKIPSVAWEKICLPVEEVGLDVRDIQVFNAALIAKWRLGSEEGGVSREFIESRYGNWRDMKNSMVDKKNSY